MPSFTISSHLNASVDTVAAAVFTLDGVNAELAPWITIQAPAAWHVRPIQQWPVQQALFTARFKLFGKLPIDWHRFCFEEITPHSFQEHSASLSQRYWRHQRQIILSIRNHKAGCQVIDQVSFASRIPGMGWLSKPIYLAIFRHRHRQLHKQFNQPQKPADTSNEDYQKMAAPL